MQQESLDLRVIIHFESPVLLVCSKAVQKKLIVGRTGHRSLEGVRLYKRVSDGQRETLSDLLSTSTIGEETEAQP